MKFLNISIQKKFKQLQSIGKIPKNLRTFCVFREPMEHLDSWYRYRTRDALLNHRHPNHKNSTKGLTYNQFVKAYLSDVRPSFANVDRQSDFKSDSTGILIENVFLIDNIRGIEDFLSETLGTLIRLKNKNISPRLKLQKHLMLDYKVYKFILKKGSINNEEYKSLLS